MSTPSMDESFELLHHDAPESVVNFVLENLHEQDSAVEYTKPQWDEFTEIKPNLLRYISQAAFELAPHDLELRQRVTQKLLGLYSVIREARVVEVLENDYIQELEPNSNEPAPAASLNELISTDAASTTRKRFFRRDNGEKQPRARGVHRSIAATILFFGLSGRVKVPSED